MRFVKADINDLPNIYAQMQKNFIRDEIRDYKDAVEVFRNENYTVYHILVQDERVGFLCVWKLPRFTFLEHFVVYEQYRGRGYGGQALELLKDRSEMLVLECEPPEEPDQKRRWNFYVNHGMIGNEPDYWQPSYREDGQRCYLKLMSSCEPASFDDVVRELYTEVYNERYE